MADTRDALTDDEREIADLMVHGLPNDEEIRGVAIKAGWPLLLEQAAIFVGYRAKRARNYLDALPEFSAYRRKLLDGRRKAEAGRNLATLIEIRDERGGNLAADRTVRIKATQAIEGVDGKGGVTVNVNQTNNTATISPGYVIRLPMRQSTNALPSPNDRDQLRIDASANSPDAVTIDAEAND